MINDEFIAVCQYETNKSFIAVWRVQLVSGENVTCNIVNYVITTGATGQKGADGTNGTNGKDGVSEDVGINHYVGGNPISQATDPIAGGNFIVSETMLFPKDVGLKTGDGVLASIKNTVNGKVFLVIGTISNNNAGVVTCAVVSLTEVTPPAEGISSVGPNKSYRV